MPVQVTQTLVVQFDDRGEEKELARILMLGIPKCGETMLIKIPDHELDVEVVNVQWYDGTPMEFNLGRKIYYPKVIVRILLNTNHGLDNV